MKFYVFFLILLNVIGVLNSNGQATNLALKYNRVFEEKTIELSQNASEYYLDWFLNGQTQKGNLLRESNLKSVQKALVDFGSEDSYSGQENLKLAYIKFLEKLISELMKSPDSQIPDDSLLVNETTCIQSWAILSEESGRLKKEVDSYFLTNRIPARKNGFRLADQMAVALNRMKFGNSLNRPVQRVRRKYKEFFVRLISDSTTQVEASRQELQKICENGIAELKALLPFSGNKKPKDAALNSMRLYRLEIVNDLPKLIQYVKKEREFVEIHRQMKAKPEATSEEKARYKQAVSEYNQNLKSANDFTKALEKNRLSHEAVFDKEYTDFLKEGINTI